MPIITPEIPNEMTIIEHWKHYMSNIPSPEPYIDWGFYAMIAAACQRRIWLSGGTMAIYPNMFVFLVGEPAIGKGNVISSVRDILKDHIIDKEKRNETTGLIEAGKLRFPLAADCTTFQALVQETALSVSFMRDVKPPYAHCSLSFMLDEIASLLNDEADQLEVFLRTAWTCKDYDKKTKHHNCDLLRNIWVNILGGITPDEMTKIVKMGITGTGLASRTIMVYSARNRFKKFFIDAPDESQMVSRAEVSAHLAKLGSLYGRIELPDNVKEYCENLIVDDRRFIACRHPKLAHYYGRKNLHILKLAICLLLSDEARLRPLEIQHIDRALEALNSIEPAMPNAIDCGGRNHLSTISIKIMRTIRERGECSLSELQAVCWEDAAAKETEEAFNFLRDHGKILPIPGKTTHYKIA